MPTEKENQQKAFELYYALGEKRTYSRVAAQLGVSPSTVKHWSRMFGWRTRVRERDAQIARQLADQVQMTRHSEVEQNLKIARLAKIKIAKAIAEERIKPQFGDLARVINLEEELTAKRADMPGQVELSDDPQELRQYAKQLLLEVLKTSDADAVYREYLVRIGKLPEETDGPPESQDPADLDKSTLTECNG